MCRTRGKLFLDVAKRGRSCISHQPLSCWYPAFGVCLVGPGREPSLLTAQSGRYMRLLPTNFVITGFLHVSSDVGVHVLKRGATRWPTGYCGLQRPAQPAFILSLDWCRAVLSWVLARPLVPPPVRRQADVGWDCMYLCHLHVCIVQPLPTFQTTNTSPSPSLTLPIPVLLVMSGSCGVLSLSASLAGR